MRKIFLSSTDIDIQGERALAKLFLNFLHKAGGPYPLFFEQFIGAGSGREDQAIAACLEAAETEATEAILILGYRAGSPCIIEEGSKFKTHLERIQKFVERKRPEIWSLLPTNGRYPPITWLETYIIKQKASMLGYHKSPSVLALIKTQLVDMARAYKKYANDDITKESLRRFLGSNKYSEFKNANTKGAGGSNNKDDWLWRMIWLCEFVCWLDDENIPIKRIGQTDPYKEIYEYIEARYKGYSHILASGTLWIYSDSQLDEVLGHFQNEFDGEVWVWNNDLAYLINRDRFHTVYQPHVDNVRLIKLVIPQSLWDNLESESKQHIYENLNQLPEAKRGKILFKCIPDDKIAKDITVTLFGMQPLYFTNHLMLIRPITWISVGQGPQFVLNLVFPNNTANSQFIQSFKENVANEFQNTANFHQLLEAVKEIADHRAI